MTVIVPTVSTKSVDIDQTYITGTRYHVLELIIFWRTEVIGQGHIVIFYDSTISPSQWILIKLAPDSHIFYTSRSGCVGMSDVKCEGLWVRYSAQDAHVRYF